ncbi:MAG: DUF2339 domain-containing protein [Deferribacteraceae bacterium]|nr:DUF2339 domain-containing protein [Deferribacteraceae bacterium]
MNILDLSLLAALVAIIYWLLFWKREHKQEPLWQSRLNIGLVIAGAVSFIWLHCALGRGVAELSQLPYDASVLYYSTAYVLLVTILWAGTGFALFRFGKKLDKQLLQRAAVLVLACAFILTHLALARVVGKFSQPQYFSATYQLSIAIFWAITGFALMLIGKKFAKRPPWLAGAILLACDAIKLLLVDLANAGTLPRIGSFMAVGLIFIVIGYFVPLPPKKGEKKP